MHWYFWINEMSDGCFTVLTKRISISSFDAKLQKNRRSIVAVLRTKDDIIEKFHQDYLQKPIEPSSETSENKEEPNSYGNREIARPDARQRVEDRIAHFKYHRLLIKFVFFHLLINILIITYLVQINFDIMIKKTKSF